MVTCQLEAGMNRNHGNALYTTLSLNDRKEGYVAIELYRATKEAKMRVARIVFWDAAGQFFFETFNGELPLEIVEELITEAKTIKIR